LPCLILLVLLVGGASAEQAKARDDDLAAYYQAAADDDAGAMLAAALRLARKYQSSYWPTIVAEHYWHGRGTPADPVQAVAWYRSAAVRGGELAMHALARAHYRGLGAEQDIEAVIFWLELAAKGKHARAMLELTIYGRLGIPFARDQKLVDAARDRGFDAVLARTRIAAQIDRDAMPPLLAAYVRSFRIFACPWAAPPDYAEAIRYLMLAVAEGWDDGPSYLFRFAVAHPAFSDGCKRE
jgi:TPR repeat protein